MKRDVSHIFNKFAGKEVKDPNRLTTDTDPVMDEMREVADKHGLRLRVWRPGMMGTMDYRTDRVNAYVEQGTDGKWRISNRFKIG